jgi:hypothetical protein
MSSSEVSQDLVTQPTGDNTEGKQPPVSRRKLEANRRNALCSTGPKTASGKEIASRNAVEHGLLAKSAVIMRGPAKENRAEFDELLNGLRDYFSPLGAAEDLLVEEIAVSYWMERRAQLYENSEIIGQARSVAVEPFAQAGYTLTPFNLSQRYGWPEKAANSNEIEDDEFGDYESEEIDVHKLLTSSEGVKQVIAMIDLLREQAETKGELSGPLLTDLSKMCGVDLDALLRNKSALLARLETEKDRLIRLKKKVEQIEAECRAAALHRSLLLESRKLEVMLRYTAANERRRYKAVARLERLQRQRAGEVLPAPVDVQVTGDAADFAKRSQ